MAAKGHGRAGCDTNGYLRKKARCGRVGGHLPHYQSTLSQRECVGGVGLAPVINCLSVLLGICPSWACNTSERGEGSNPSPPRGPPSWGSKLFGILDASIQGVPPSYPFSHPISFLSSIPEKIPQENVVWCAARLSLFWHVCLR
jgi:hypothetical protein